MCVSDELIILYLFIIKRVVLVLACAANSMLSRCLSFDISILFTKNSIFTACYTNSTAHMDYLLEVKIKFFITYWNIKKMQGRECNVYWGYLFCNNRKTYNFIGSQNMRNLGNSLVFVGSWNRKQVLETFFCNVLKKNFYCWAYKKDQHCISAINSIRHNL